MNLLEELACFAADCQLADIPVSVRQRARAQMASVLGAIYAAEGDLGAMRVRRWAATASGEGAASIIGTRQRASASAALLANASASCTFDYDDYQLVGHTGHSAALVSLLLGERLDASWQQVELAQIVAAELGGRLGLACFLGPQNGQHLPFVHHLAGAAAAAKLLGLDADVTAHAFALALAQPETALWPAFLGTADGKILTAAHAAVQGMVSAELAASGVSGARHILDHPKGFFVRFAFLPAPKAFCELGRTWTLDSLHVKEHPACAYFQTTIDAAAELAQLAKRRLGRALTAGDVRHLRLETTFLGAAVDAHGRAVTESTKTNGVTPNEVNFSSALTCGLALLDGELTPSSLAEEHLRERSAALRTLRERTSVVHAWDLSRTLLEEVGGALGASALLADSSWRDCVRAVGEVRRHFPKMPVDKAVLRAALGDVGRALWRLARGGESPMAKSLEGLCLRFATRVHLSLQGGIELMSERPYPRGGPDKQQADVARAKLVNSATAVLGAEGAEALAERILAPSPGQTVREVLALTQPLSG